MKVSDNQGGTSTKDFTIVVKDEDNTNTPPGVPALDGKTAVTVAENTQFSGTLTAPDNETVAGMTFAFDATQLGGGNANGMFVIDGNKLKLAPGKVLDYEAIQGAKNFVVYVKAIDGNGTPGATQAIIINVQDIDATVPNHPPSNLTLAGSKMVQELAVNGSVIGAISATDADGDGLSYKIVTASGARVDADAGFRISNGSLVVDNGVKFDFEQATFKQVTVEASDGRGGTTRQTFTINVTDLATERMTAGSASAENDVIKSGNGKDVLFGGAGDDILWAGSGNDTLTGGSGKDVFVFEAKPDKKKNMDKITDFNVKDDSIYLENKYFTKAGSGSITKLGKLKKDAFYIGSKAHDASDRIIYDKKKGILYYDQDGTGSKAAVQIATINKNLKMTEKDFFII